MERRIGQAFLDLPWEYDKGDEVSVVFRTDREALEPLLPPVLTLPDGPGLMVLSASHHARSTFGPYVGVYLGMLAIHEGRTVLHRLTGMKTAFSGTAAGRELWGMPLLTGEPSMKWSGDVLNVVARRYGVEFARLSLKLERRTAQPPARFADMTSVVRRAAWDEGEKRNLLMGTDITPADPKDMVFWTGSAVLKLTGGDPGDDWSQFPMREVVSASYSHGGHSALNGPVLLESF